MESMVKKEEDMDDAATSSHEGTSKEAKGGVNIILNSTSEFCRSLGEIPTYGLAGNREEEREEIMVSIRLQLHKCRIHGLAGNWEKERDYGQLSGCSYTSVKFSDDDRKLKSPLKVIVLTSMVSKGKKLCTTLKSETKWTASIL